MVKKVIRPAYNRYFSILSALCTTFLLLGLVLQSRLVLIGPLTLSTTVFVYPLSCFMLDIIAEVYGYQYARQALWGAIFANVVFASVIAAAIHFRSPHFWHVYTYHFDKAMQPIFRTMSFGMVAILVGQFINIYVISKCRLLTHGRFFVIRSIGSTIVGEVVTALIALVGIFLHRMPVEDIVTLLAGELLVMAMLAVILSGPAAVLVHLLQRVEPTINDSPKIHFNPFSLKLD